MWVAAALSGWVVLGTIHRLVEIEAEEIELNRVEREMRWHAAAVKEVEERKSSRAIELENSSASTSDCKKCRYYHGVNYYGNFFVCGMYPYGMENCPDWEPFSNE